MDFGVIFYILFLTTMYMAAMFVARCAGITIARNYIHLGYTCIINSDFGTFFSVFLLIVNDPTLAQQVDKLDLDEFVKMKQTLAIKLRS